MSSPQCDTHINNFCIVYSSPELTNQKFVEAITNTTKPLINVKLNELFDFLRLF